MDYNTTALIPNPPGTQTRALVSCDAGMYATGGGVETDGAFSAAQEVNMSAPTPAHTGWDSYVDNRGATNRNIRGYVICMTPTQVTAPGSMPAMHK